MDDERTSDAQERALEDSARAGLLRRHLLFGWWSLLVFLLLGLALEILHAYKIGFYLDVASETRRLMWTLSHAHGTLVALLNLAFAFTLRWIEPAWRWGGLASACLLAASLCLPAGFFLGGVFIHGGDPGAAVVLSPLGGGLLVAAVCLIAWGVSSSRAAQTPAGRDS